MSASYQDLFSAINTAALRKELIELPVGMPVDLGRARGSIGVLSMCSGRRYATTGGVPVIALARNSIGIKALAGWSADLERSISPAARSYRQVLHSVVDRKVDVRLGPGQDRISVRTCAAEQAASASRS